MVRSVACSAPQLALPEWVERELAGLFARLDAHPADHIPPGELSIALLTEAELAAVHAAFLNDSSPTDVITFPGDPAEDFAGEICVSVERAQYEAAERGLSFSEELTLYLVHGWLHLAGYDDCDDCSRAQMRDGEARILHWLGQTSSLPDFSGWNFS